MQVYVMWLHLIFNTILPMSVLMFLNISIYRKLNKVMFFGSVHKISLHHFSPCWTISVQYTNQFFKIVQTQFKAHMKFVFIIHRQGTTGLLSVLAASPLLWSSATTSCELRLLIPHFTGLLSGLAVSPYLGLSTTTSCELRLIYLDQV